MSWLVVDANAAGKLSADPTRNGISMSPYVLAEIWCKVLQPTRILERLEPFEVRIGLWTPDITGTLATATLDEIETFTPFPIPGRTYLQDYDLLAKLLNPGWDPGDWASRVKAQGRAFNQMMADASASIRAKIDAGKVEPLTSKIGSVDELVDALSTADDSYLPWHIHNLVYDGGKRRTRYDQRTLADACLANPHLWRFFLGEVYYTIATTGWARDLRLTPPSTKKDDFTDVILPAYAGDGDVVVTGDKLVRHIVEFLEPEGTVTVRDANDIQSAPGARGSA